MRKVLLYMRQVWPHDLYALFAHHSGDFKAERILPMRKCHAVLILCSELSTKSKKVSQKHLVAACVTLKSCRNELMHVKTDSGCLDNVSSSFEAGRLLLAFFPPNGALDALALLDAQFRDHKQFKNEPGLELDL